MQKRLVILGAGESGVGTALLAKQQGYDVFVSDGGAIKDNYRNELNEHAIEFEEGQHSTERILNADEVMKSPGINEKNELIKQIRAKGIDVISEIEFAYRYKGNSKIIAITTIIAIGRLTESASLTISIGPSILPSTELFLNHVISNP